MSGDAALAQGKGLKRRMCPGGHIGTQTRRRRSFDLNRSAVVSLRRVIATLRRHGVRPTGRETHLCGQPTSRWGHSQKASGPYSPTGPALRGVAQYAVPAQSCQALGAPPSARPENGVVDFMHPKISASASVPFAIERPGPASGATSREATRRRYHGPIVTRRLRIDPGRCAFASQSRKRPSRPVARTGPSLRACAALGPTPLTTMPNRASPLLTKSQTPRTRRAIRCKGRRRTRQAALPGGSLVCVPNL